MTTEPESSPSMVLHHFGDDGEPKGLWVHGWMGSGREGEALAEALGCSLICPDLPGHGNTPLGDWTLPEVLRELATLAESYAWAGGYSMGARLLMMAAMSRPESFGPLVLESGFWGYDSSQERNERLQVDQTRGQDLIRQGLEAFCDSWYQHPMWGGYVPPPRNGNESELAGALQRFSSGLQPDLTPWLRTASSQVLWLAGAKDPAYAERADWVRRHTPHRVVKLDTGHNLHGQDPEGWSQAVRHFVQPPTQTEQE